MQNLNLEPRIKVYDPVGEINNKFDFYIKIVVGVLLVAVITMLLMVGGLILDSLHFNSAVYKEYSDKTQSVDSVLKTNKELLEQNQKNQLMIIQQQKDIKELWKNAYRN